MKDTAILEDMDIVKSDKATIYLGNIFTVDTDLILPKEGKLGSKITWKSKNICVISNEGKVTRPEAESGNAIVSLQATITKGEAVDTKEYEVTVVQKERVHRITGINEVVVETTVGLAPELPRLVMTRKEDGSYGVENVTWESFDLLKYSYVGDFKVEGVVYGTNLKALANIRVNKTLANSLKTSDNSFNRTLVNPFDLCQVTLQDSVFTENRDRDEEFLLFCNDDQMLYNFREAAGLDTKKVTPLDGWDAPECKLRGHTTGHYLTALAQAYKSSGDSKFKRKLDYMVRELGECQEVMEKSGNFSPGFLSGYSEEQFIKLEELTTYPTIWAPYYTLHKIMAGLLDCYQLADNVEALEICKRIGDWVYNRLSKLSKEQLNKMWSLYIAGEFGGMNEVMAKLYGITHKEIYLITAKYFDNDKLYVPMTNNIDTLGGMHANQHIPQIIGVLQMFEESKNRVYYDIANNFWDMVVGAHTYSIGGTGEGEMFKAADKIASYITNKTAETCATYNMLKLSRNLFFHNPEAKYMDYYERALYNHILASQDQSSPNGGSTYFMPLCPGMKKEFDSEGNSCCHGTGMENHTKYQDSIYFKSEDNSALYVNLYIPSTLNWRDKGLKITQTGNYLIDQAVLITVDGNAKLDMKFRVPYWIEEGFTVKINGIEQNLQVISGNYITISREWLQGDKIHISMPFRFRLERTPDDSSVGSIMYGPLVMVGKSEVDKYIELKMDMSDISKSIEPTEDPLVFTTNGIILIPNYAANRIPYHAYFKIK
jgi:uncharacterized protein